MGEPHLTVSPAQIFARPTADLIWLGPAQCSALSQLSTDAAVKLLIGPKSTGKSTVLNHFGSEALDSVVLRLASTQNDTRSVLGDLLLSAGLAPWELSDVEQRNLLSVLIQQRRAQGKKVIVAIDDAHHLEAQAWEELWRLRSMRLDDEPALECVLCGQERLVEQLLALDPLDDQSTVTVHTMRPATESELSAYIAWRLARYELPALFSPTAIRLIVRSTGGCYAAVDILCQMTLLLLRQSDQARADARMVREAALALAEKHRDSGAQHVGGDNRGNGSDRAVSGNKPQRAPPQGELFITREGKSVGRFTLRGQSLIGRSEHNDLCLPSPYLSRHHALIVGTAEGFYIADLNSLNGLLVNGQLVTRAALANHDIIGLGPFKLKVRLSHTSAHANALPASESLADTTVMPAQLQTTAPVRIIK